MELEICKKVGWTLITGPYNSLPNQEVSSTQEPAFLMLKDVPRAISDLPIQEKQKLCSKFLNGNLNSILGAMTEEWDFWLNEEAAKKIISEELLVMVEQLVSK